MITNHRQYLNTQAHAGKFRQALAAPDQPGFYPKAAKVMCAGLGSQQDDREQELTEYKALRDRKVSMLEVGSNLGICAAPIKARIAGKLTQRELAGRLSLAGVQAAQRGDAIPWYGRPALIKECRCVEAASARGYHFG